MDNRNSVKNSKKFNFWKTAPRKIIAKANKEDKTTISFTPTTPLSVKNKKLEKNPSILKFKKSKNKQNKMKKV